MTGAMGSGALVPDAALAAYAIQNRATLHSNDADFSRFAGLSWKNPLAG
jgi:predicted nucleic acid-binding protein